MMDRRVFLLAGLSSAAAPSRASAASFDLRLDRLIDRLKSLSAADRAKVDQSIGLIRRGENLAAFAPLLEVVKANPNNSGARVVLAYTLIQLGNLAGAFDHASLAEKLKGANSYVCLFLAKVAAVTGNETVCRRELKHLEGDQSLAKDVEAVKAELAKKTSR